MYLATVLRSRPSWRAMAETVRPCRCSSKIIMSSPRLTTVPLPPATGSSIGEKDATLAPRISPQAVRRADKTGECSKPTNGEDLTPAHTAGRAAVLPRHPDRVLALLQEAGLVDDQHAVRGPEMLDDVVAAQISGRVLVPQHVAEHPLRSPGSGIADLLGKLPAVLAFRRAQQA